MGKTTEARTDDLGVIGMRRAQKHLVLTQSHGGDEEIGGAVGLTCQRWHLCLVGVTVQERIGWAQGRHLSRGTGVGIYPLSVIEEEQSSPEREQKNRDSGSIPVQAESAPSDHLAQGRSSHLFCGSCHVLVCGDETLGPCSVSLILFT